MIKKFNELVKENESTKRYKYTATIQVEGYVSAMSESDAGEMADAEINKVEGLMDYKLITLDEVKDNLEQKENV